MRTLLAAAALSVAIGGTPLRAARLLAQAEPVASRPTHVPPPADTLTEADSSTSTAPPRPNCWRPQGNPPCAGYFVTEFGVEEPLASTRRNDRSAVGVEGTGRGTRGDFGPRIVWSFGFMGTRGSHSHGGVLSITSDEGFDTEIPLMFEYRYRRWLGRSAVDAGAGLRRVAVWKDGTGLVVAKGATAMVGFTLNHYIGVTVRGDLVRAAGRERRAIALGVRSGRLSEVALKYTALLLARAALGAIGVELEEDEQ